jgi:DNA-binding response OmpR family regulator
MPFVHNSLGEMSQDTPLVPTMQKLPAFVSLTEKISLLVVSPDQGDCLSLERILDNSRWTILRASSYREATRLIRESNPSLVLCERDLSDGNWKDVFRTASGLRVPPAVVVVSRQADERLWAEVLNVGGFDLLLKPFEVNEVRRVMNMASRHNHRLADHRFVA